MQSSERMEVPFRHSLRAKLLVGLMLALAMMLVLSLIHISEPTRLLSI